MNINPLVSIVIPCYNHASFVQEAIQSIIDQDYQNIELIIIDDGSQDNSIEVIKEMIPACEKRFKRFEFRHRPNKGLCATLNEAIDWCEGKFFAPLASDDMILPHKTNTQISFFHKNNDDSIVGVFGNISTLVEEENNQNLNTLPLKDVRVFDFKDIFLRKSKLPAPTAMLNLAKLRAVGGYNENLKIEDFYLWLKLTENGDKLALLDSVFSLYRRHPGNLSQVSGVMISGVEEILKNYSDNIDYKEALARSYLVHAGDLAQDGASGSFKYMCLGLKSHPSLIFSKIILVYFYRMLLGYKNK